MNHESDKQRLYNAAIRLLASREHSVLELKQKLNQRSARLKLSAAKQDLSELIDEVIQSLQEQGLQSDLRFAEAVVRSRISRGYGPFYIEQALRTKGISSAQLDEVEAWHLADWTALARELKDRRFPDVCAETRYEDPKSYQKAARALQQKGFSGSVIARVLVE